MSERPGPSAVEPGSEAAEIIEAELALLAEVQKQLAEHSLPAGEAQAYDSELVALRDQIAEARAEDLAPLVSEMYRLQALGQAGGRGRELPVDVSCPYFGHLILKDGPREKRVLIGNRAFVKSGAKLAIVDWRNAPVSRIYYCYEEGDEYEEVFGRREVVGTVLARRTVGIIGGELRRVSWSGGSAAKNAAGIWMQLPDSARPTLSGGAGIAARPPRATGAGYRRSAEATLGVVGDESLRDDKHLKEITALIDPEQFKLITKPDSGTIIVQGGAGSGKTTVALHRAAYLHFNNPKIFSPKKMAIVVKSAPLTEYISRVLPSLDVVGTKVTTLEGWMKATRRKVLPELKQPVTEDVPGAVAKLKKHPATLYALERAQAEEEEALLEALCKGLRPAAAGLIKRRWDQLKRSGYIVKLRELSRWVDGPGRHQARLSEPERSRLQGILRRSQQQADDIYGAWADTLTDRALLMAAFEERGRGVRPAEVEELIRWVSQQSEDRAPVEDEDPQEPSIHKGVDGRQLDDGGPQGSLDPHDDALLLKLTQLRYGGLPIAGSQRSVRYEHIVVDEAQDLSPTDVAVLRGALTPRQSMTLAGDTAQKLVFDNGFDDWETMLADVGVAGLKIDQLSVSYRSTQEIVDFSRAVLGPLVDPQVPVVPRQGAPVEQLDFGSTGEAVAFLGEALRSLAMRERRANVAVVARYAAQADLYYQSLKKSEVPALRRVYGKDFSFQPGVDVVDVAQIKGLEYDYVILVEVNDSSYPDKKEARHLLHIGATRAVHQLWVSSVGAPSPLLPKLVDATG